MSTRRRARSCVSATAHATYGVGPRKMIDGYAYILPHGAWVNLGFFQGAGLADPEGLLTGTGARLRHVKVRLLIEAALAERKGAIGR